MSSMPPGVVPSPVDPSSAPSSSGRDNYLPTQSQALHYSASSSPLARRPSSGVNEEDDVRANAAVVDGHADVRASAVMTHVNDELTTVFSMTLCEILVASSRVATSLDLDLTFGAVVSNVDLTRTHLLSPLSPSSSEKYTHYTVVCKFHKLL